MPLDLCFTFPDGRSTKRFFAPECVFCFIEVVPFSDQAGYEMQRSFVPGTDKPNLLIPQKPRCESRDLRSLRIWNRHVYLRLKGADKEFCRRILFFGLPSGRFEFSLCPHWHLAMPAGWHFRSLLFANEDGSAAMASVETRLKSTEPYGSLDNFRALGQIYALRIRMITERNTDEC